MANKIDSPENKDIFHDFFEQSADPILILENGLFTDCNQAAQKALLAPNKEDILPIAPALISPEYQPDGRLSSEKANEMIALAFQKGNHRFEWMHKRLDGEDLPVEITLTAINLEERQVVYALWRDITERKQAEQKIQESQQLLQSFLNNFPDGAWAKDLEGHFLVANRYVVKDIYGTTEDQVLGKTVYDTFPKEVADFLWGSEKRLIETGETLSVEEGVPQADGKVYNKITTKFPLYDTTGKINGLGGVLVDITERKKAEDAVKESQRRLSLLIDTSPLAVIEWNKDFEVVSWNPAAERIFGYPAKEALGKHARFIIPPEYHQFVDQVWQGLLTQTGGERATNANVTKDGRTIICEWYNTPLADADGKVFGASSLVEDVTERKRAEGELLQLQSAVEQTGDGIAIVDLDGNMRYSNPAWATMHGYTVEEILGKHLSIFHTQEQLEREVIPFNEKVMAAGVNTSEVGHVRKDGTTFPTLMTTVIQKDENGAPIGLIGTLRDITERKQAEELLQQSEANLSSALRVAQMGYWEFDIPTQTFTFNDQYYSLLGTTAKEAGGYQMSAEHFATHYVPAEDAAIVQSSIIKALQATDPNFQTQFETRNLRADGTPIWTIVWFRIRKNAQGETIKLYGVSQDITERKQLGLEIQEAFERRGRQVQISTEIAQEIAVASELSELFNQVVTLTKERLGYYHAQLLRYEESQNAVVLIQGYGEIGQKMLADQHQMPLGSGLIGTAAASGQTVLRSNLADDHDWKPNPLLPETRGEIAVPIKLGSQILGVLDVQSNQAGALSEDDRLLLEGLCGQIAVAIEQTRLRQQMNDRLEEVNRLYQSMSREGWKTYRETANLPAGFAFDQTGVRPVEEMFSTNETFANIPMKVLGGEVVGSLSIANDPNRPITPEDESFLQQVSEQIALALESARLFEQTQSALAQTERLSEAGLRFARSANLQELLVVVTDTLNITSINRALLGVFNYDSNNELESMDVTANWWSGNGHQPTEIGRHYTQETLSILPMFKTPVPIFFGDTFIDERVVGATRETFTSQNIRALAVLPLFLGTRQIGCLFLESEDTHTFTQDEIRLFTAMAPQIATVVENRRQFEKTQQQAERESTLNLISQKIQSATTVDAVLQIAARELGHALGAPMTIAQLSMKEKK